MAETRESMFKRQTELPANPRAASEPLRKAEKNPPLELAPDDELLRAERKNPEGAPALAHEWLYTPWLMGALAVIGLIVVGSVMGAAAGWRAALLGIVWLMLGYAVSWIVVWGAGLMRLKEEQELEEIIIEYGAPPPSVADRAGAHG